MKEKKYCPRCKRGYATDRSTCPICGTPLEDEDTDTDRNWNEDADDVITIINAMMNM